MNAETLTNPFGIATPMCAARVLGAWLPPDRVAQYLNGGDTAIDVRTQAQIEQWNAGRFARPVFEQTSVIEAAPPELGGYIEQLAELPPFAPYAAEGWQVRVADLRGVIAAQPHVFVSEAGRRLNLRADASLAEIATFTLPLERQVPVAIAPLSDPNFGTKAFKIVSDDPTLRVDLLPSGSIQIGAQHSFMQVASYAGRYIMRDGYHRAVELVEAGIHSVPVIYREIRNVDELFPPAQRPGLLPEGTWMSERPALLPDYADETVSIGIDVPKPNKAVVIQITEMPWP